MWEGEIITRPVDFPALQQRIGVSCHAARVDVSGVRSDQGHDVFDLRHSRRSQESVHHLVEVPWHRPDRTRRPPPPASPWAAAPGRLPGTPPVTLPRRPVGVSCIHPHTPAMGCWQYWHFPLPIGRLYQESFAVHYHAAALGAIRLLRRMAGNVAHVDIVQSFRIAGGLGPLQRLKRSRRQVRQQVLRNGIGKSAAARPDPVSTLTHLARPGTPGRCR